MAVEDYNKGLGLNISKCIIEILYDHVLAGNLEIWWSIIISDTWLWFPWQLKIKLKELAKNKILGTFKIPQKIVRLYICACIYVCLCQLKILLQTVVEVIVLWTCHLSFTKSLYQKKRLIFFNTLLIKDEKQSNHADIYNTDLKASKNRR